MSDHTIKRGENLTRMLVALTDRKKEPLNITGATVLFHYRRAGTSTWSSGGCEYVNATLGHVSGPDVVLSEVDNYQGYFTVTFPTQDPVYVPSRGYFEIEVEESAG